MAINIHSITAGLSAQDECHIAVAGMLPDAMARAVRGYQKLAKKSDDLAGPDKDLKTCQLHQAACKAALQHIEILMKLAAASSSQKTKSQNADIADLMAKAGHELNAYQANTTDKKEEEPP